MKLTRILLALPLTLLSAQASAAGPVEIGVKGEAKVGDDGSEASGEATADADASAGADASDAPPEYAPEGTTRQEWEKVLMKRKKWIHRYAPVPMQGEFGIFGGVMLVHPNHDFYNPQSAPQIPLWSLGPDIGGRIGFFPWRIAGFEVEGMLSPTKLRNPGDDSALLWGVRGHAMLRGPWRVSPFLVAGFGAMAISSDASLQGKDIDPAFHYGVGMEIFMNRWLAFRLDARHILAPKERQQDDRVSHAELLAGLSFTLGRDWPEVPPPEPPPEPSDRDGDGVTDGYDACPDEPGLPDRDGCPPPPDTDGDGFIDAEDKCPEEPGVEEYGGCPIPDTDGDGFLDPDDKCVNEPETQNGFEDNDGCPDELPEPIKEFSGVIEGITFANNSDVIRRKSRPTLDKAIKVLKEYPEIQLEVVGHTDDKGSREHNLDLSKRRAASVVKYLTEGGVDASRLRSRGAGPDEPLVDNDSAANRAKNRRTEFHLLSKDELEGKAKPAGKPEPAPAEEDPPTDAP